MLAKSINASQIVVFRLLQVIIVQNIACSILPNKQDLDFNTKTKSEIRSMLEIAISEDENGIYQKDIAKNQDIS